MFLLAGRARTRIGASQWRDRAGFAPASLFSRCDNSGHPKPIKELSNEATITTACGVVKRADPNASTSDLGTAKKGPSKPGAPVLVLVASFLHPRSNDIMPRAQIAQNSKVNGI